ncbi:MAG TPA: GntR family transcriptional regulator [Pseudolysinimonas sp.]|nr:GntR family transcriptional regulator [Pseudolysinimonas sp.]
MPVRAESYDDVPKPVFTQTRDIAVQVHAYLRKLIVDDVLSAGRTLNQANLAAHLGVSRIPMREAFRMLQQEGLIDVELNQRATIRAFSPSELDSLYGTRIALEALAVRMTAGHVDDDGVAAGERMLDGMRAALADGDVDAWIEHHRAFHQLVTSEASDPITQIMHSLAERTERYVRFVQHMHPGLQKEVEQEHRAILLASHEGDAALAGALMAEHLSHTARHVVDDLGWKRPNGAIYHSYVMATGRKRPRRRFAD